MEALRLAPRRYRMPPLPAGADAAAALGTDVALAFALEGARSAADAGTAPPAALQDLFTRALATAIRDALAPQGGDAAFQALVLRAQDPAVQEHVRLSAARAGHARRVRSAIDAFAHPGKLAAMQPPQRRQALERLHALASTDDWEALHDELRAQAADGAAGEGNPALPTLAAQPELQALLRLQSLQRLDAVRRYRALCALQGPDAGSAAASAQGQASARAGEDAEQRAAEALAAVAQQLDRLAGGASGRYRLLRSLRPPAGFPGAAAKAKDEWDAAIVHAPSAAGAAEIVLLVEVKASPAAATPDLGRLLRGLQRLAEAEPGQAYAFPSAAGDIRIAGGSLRALRPQGLALPPHVIYACAAPPEVQPPWLSAATRGVLLAQPASIAFAQALAQGDAPSPEVLAPVWHALPTAAHLRSALHQFQTARAAREAMLHPDDLLAALRTVAGEDPPVQTLPVT